MGREEAGPLRAELPPKYVVIPVELVYGAMPKGILRTAVRLWGLGWRSFERQVGYRYAGPVHVDRLRELCQISRRQLYEHLRYLIRAGVLRYTQDRGQFTFTFGSPDRFHFGAVCAENRTDMGMGVGVGVSPPESDSESQSGGEQHQQQTGAREALVELGVLEPTLSRLLGLEWMTEEYVAGWAVWFKDEADLGVGYLVSRWRKGEGAPETRGDRELRKRRAMYAEQGILT